MIHLLLHVLMRKSAETVNAGSRSGAYMAGALGAAFGVPLAWLFGVFSVWDHLSFGEKCGLFVPLTFILGALIGARFGNK